MLSARPVAGLAVSIAERALALVLSANPRVKREVGLARGDVMEVAPHVARSEGGGPRRVALAARYLRETIDAGARALVSAGSEGRPRRAAPRRGSASR